MVNYTCVNGTLEWTEKYSDPEIIIGGVMDYLDPVPLMGLYIAAASMVCSLLMLYDIISGLSKRQIWLPGKWFKLDSITLFLIGVVVTVSVDLRTSMPSAVDQLSKLLGTTSLCIYMCYIFPSLGILKDSTNMLSLSFLVITVIGKMCIQIYTGVIALFIPEHIIVMSFMMLLLLIEWHYIFTLKNKKKGVVKMYRSLFILGDSNKQDSFYERLKLFYLRGFEKRPQVTACVEMECGLVGDFSMICMTILIQAAVRSLILKKENLHTGNSSDYKWSIVVIVSMQLVLVTVGTFAAYFRRCTMTSHAKSDSLEEASIVEKHYLGNPIWKHKLKFFLVDATNKVYTKIIVFSYKLLSAPILAFSWLQSKMRSASTNNHTRYRPLPNFHAFLGDGEWLLWISTSSMDQLIERSTRKSNDLCDLLSSIPPHPSQAGHTAVEASRYQGPTPRDLEASYDDAIIPTELLPLVLLVRIAEVALPESLSRRMTLTFQKAFETLYFICNHLPDKSPDDIEQTEVGKAVWIAGDFRHLLPDSLNGTQQFDGMDRALRVINHINAIMMPSANTIGTSAIGLEVLQIKRTVTHWTLTFPSVAELSYFMEDLFFDGMGLMLAKLPEAIFHAMIDSSDDDFEEFVERARQSLKHFSKFISWDGIHRWKVPRGFGECTGLIDPEIDNLGTRGPSSTQNQDNDVILGSGDEHNFTQRASTSQPTSFSTFHDTFFPNRTAYKKATWLQQEMMLDTEFLMSSSQIPTRINGTSNVWTIVSFLGDVLFRARTAFGNATTVEEQKTLVGALMLLMEASGMPNGDNVILEYNATQRASTSQYTAFNAIKESCFAQVMKSFGNATTMEERESGKRMLMTLLNTFGMPNGARSTSFTLNEGNVILRSDEETATQRASTSQPPSINTSQETILANAMRSFGNATTMEEREMASDVDELLMLLMEDSKMLNGPGSTNLTVNEGNVVLRPDEETATQRASTSQPPSINTSQETILENAMRAFLIATTMEERETVVETMVVQILRLVMRSTRWSMQNEEHGAGNPLNQGNDAIFGSNEHTFTQRARTSQPTSINTFQETILANPIVAFENATTVEQREMVVETLVVRILRFVRRTTQLAYGR